MQSLLTAEFQDYDRPDFARPAVLYVLKYARPKIVQEPDSRHYLKNSTIDMSPDERPDMEKTMSSEIEFAAGRVSFDASWFTVQKYIESWKTYLQKFLAEHADIQMSLEAIRTDFPSNWGDQLAVVGNLLDAVYSMLTSSYNGWHRKSMAEFCDSNLPLEVYNLYSISYIERISVVRTFKDELGRLQRMLYLVRSNNKKIANVLHGFEERHRVLSRLFAETSRSELVLKFYLKSFNAKEMKDMFRPIPMTVDCNDKRFRTCLDDFRSNLFEMTRILNRGTVLRDHVTMTLPASESFRNFGENLNQIILKHG